MRAVKAALQLVLKGLPLFILGDPCPVAQSRSVVVARADLLAQLQRLDLNQDAVDASIEADPARGQIRKFTMGLGVRLEDFARVLTPPRAVW